MVTTGTLIENTDARNYFISSVQSPAHAQIVYHTTVRHSRAGITAPVSEYGSDNPSTGVSEAGLGADGTIITATTVYNHLTAATRNITHIRLCQANFYRTTDNFSPNTGPVNVLQGSVGPSVTVRPISFRQGVGGVNNGGVASPNVATAASYNNLCTNMYNTWNSLKNNRSDFNVIYCHTSCHTNCHTSRGRR